MPSMKLLLLPAIPAAIAVIAIVADDGEPAPKHEVRHHVRHIRDRDDHRELAPTPPNPELVRTAPPA